MPNPASAEKMDLLRYTETEKIRLKEKAIS